MMRKLGWREGGSVREHRMMKLGWREGGNVREHRMMRKLGCLGT
jgi:hypothetical protein